MSPARFPPIALWGKSLPFRVVVLSLVASVVILLATGLFLMDQSSRGIIAGKTQAAVAEASAVVQAMQSDLNTTDPRTTSINERITRLAREAANRGRVGSQYYVVVETPVSQIGTTELSPDSVPASIREAVGTTDGLLSTPTLISFTDGRPDQPGIVVAATLTAPVAQRYPVFFLFSTAQEQQTLQIVQQATLATGFFLLVGLSLTVYLIARQVLRPVRAARLAAERMAAGHLDARMDVVGTEDLASLATSMNHMATELDRKLTQLQDLSLVQQRFVSDVSHELRTPLTTIRMAADVLHANREDFDAPTARSAELLAAELDRFEDMLTDLLEISRFDAGAAELSLDEVDLTQLVSAELAAVEPLAAEFGAVVTLDAPRPCRAEADPRRIRRIVRNLITNAIEHSEGRPIAVHVRSAPDAVAVAVRDHGVGLDDEQAQYVFDRFWRADPARGRRVGGTGLGLSIALEDAHLHGGTLEVWGQPGGGAQFVLTVPRRAGTAPVSRPWPLEPADREVTGAIAR